MNKMAFLIGYGFEKRGWEWFERFAKAEKKFKKPLSPELKKLLSPKRKISDSLLLGMMGGLLFSKKIKPSVYKKLRTKEKGKLPVAKITLRKKDIPITHENLELMANRLKRLNRESRYSKEWERQYDVIKAYPKNIFKKDIFKKDILITHEDLAKHIEEYLPKSKEKLLTTKIIPPKTKNWLADNWPLLAGGAGLGVGGLALYNLLTDKNEEEE